MLTTCPECAGKLSSVAPSCPHCGYEQKNAVPPAATAPSAGPAEAKTDPLLPVIPPSPIALKKASKQVFAEWNQSPAKVVFFGTILLGIALALLLLVLFLRRT